MKSIWEKEVAMPVFPEQKGDLQTEVLIIGGGMAGILCGYFLQKYGIDYCLVEAGRIAEGVTGHTTAKLTVQHGLLYRNIERRYGTEAARMYYVAQCTALENYRVLCSRMECGFEEQDNYVYSVKNPGKLEKEMRTLERIGAKPVFSDTLPLPFPVYGGVGLTRQAQFHPLKFLAQIAKGLNIYENTRVMAFGTYNKAGDGMREILTNRGRIRAKNVIVATHFPMLNKHGSYFMKLYQHRSYVLALKNAPCLPAMYVDEDAKGFSFRRSGEYLLLGGGGHRTGKPGGSYPALYRTKDMFYPAAEEVCHWATQDCMSLDRIPYIGPYSGRTEGLYVATGFNKWGMTSSMVAAMLLPDRIRGKRNEFEPLFSPSRIMITGQLGVNLLESTMGLLSFSKKRCPHLGCALKWNKEEHSWDCPCHGSRFSEAGEVLDNPANASLQK